MAVKTDRNDARAIAQAIRVGWYTAVHVKTNDSQELRLLLTNRKTLLATQLVIDNDIRGTLKAFNLKVGAGRPATASRHGNADVAGARCTAPAIYHLAPHDAKSALAAGCCPLRDAVWVTADNVQHRAALVARVR
jgi:transposase